MNLRSDASIVILTGAGISAESGLATFRASDGLWEQHRIEDVATPEGFVRDPALVHRFYNERRRQLQTVEPNAAHLALAEREKKWEGPVLLVTQNVDDLHERSGSHRLIHMHGELKKARCLYCGSVHAWDGDTGPESPCPACGKAPALRPHIVWFGEMPLFMETIYRGAGQLRSIHRHRHQRKCLPSCGLCAGHSARCPDPGAESGTLPGGQ